MAYKWLRRIIGGLSFTSALFIFQACYGTPHDDFEDVYIKGQVTSTVTGKPLKGIRVYVTEDSQYEFTSEDGRYSLHAFRTSAASIRFESLDTVTNNYLILKDTVLSLSSSQVTLDVKLDSK